MLRVLEPALAQGAPVATDENTLAGLSTWQHMAYREGIASCHGGAVA